MAFGNPEVQNLVIKLTLGGNFKSAMANASKSLKQLDQDSTRAYRAGTQIGVGIKRSAILAVGAVGTLTGALAVAVKEGQDAANVQKIYAQAISNSHKVTADQVKALNAQQKALESLAGVDDELIKSEQTRLIQMGLSGKATEKLTPLILDASKATGKDLLTVTIAAGKAANGNATALQRLGIQVDKTRFKADPLAETIRVLNERFGGTTKALSGSFDTRLAALREHLKDISEDVGIKLLPALTRIVDVVGAKLVPALGQAVDRLLPEISTGLNDFADALASGKAQESIKGITDALGPMVDLVKVAAQPVKQIVNAFLSLPKEVQTVLVGAFAVNKLTGGLVTNVAGGVVESLGKALIGGIKAPVVNVDGAVVNVNGAAGGLPGGSAAPGLLGTLTGLAIPVTIAAVGAKAATDLTNAQFADKGIKTDFQAPGSGILPFGIEASIHDIAEFIRVTTAQPALTGGMSPDDRQAANDRDAKMRLVKDLDSSFRPSARVLKEAAAELKQAAAAQRNKVVARSKVIAATGARHDAETSSSVRGLIPKVSVKTGAVSTNVKVNVNVTAGGIHKTVTVQQRYGPATGSRNSSARQLEGFF